MTRADLNAEPIEYWPCCERPIHLFMTVRTQWRTGMGGPTGLDYNVLYHKLDRMQLDADEYESLESDIRVLESAALEKMSEKDG